MLSYCAGDRIADGCVGGLFEKHRDPGIDGIQSHAASGRTAGVPYSRIVFIREDGADGIANRQPTVGSAGAPV